MQPLPLEFFLGYAFLAVACERCGEPVYDEDEPLCQECHEALDDSEDVDFLEDEDDG